MELWGSGACLSSTLCPSPWGRHDACSSVVVVGGGAGCPCAVRNPHSCARQAGTPQPCGRAHAEFHVSRQPLFSLLSPSLFSRPPGGEEKYQILRVLYLHLILPTTLHFSSSLCSWWLCLGSGSEEDRGLGAAPLSPGHRPRAAQGAGGVPRATCRGRHAEGRPRDVQVSSEGQLVPAGPRCSRCFQMFRMKKHFPEKASDVQFAEQTGRGYKHHVRSAWGPQAPGAGGVFGDPPAEWREIQGVHPLAKSLLVI